MLTYERFRTGLTYREVYHMIYGRQWKRRHGVLGKWRELKLAMYAEYVNDRQSARRRARRKAPARSAGARVGSRRSEVL